MSILVFDDRYTETAHALELRTGLKIVRGAWKPEAEGIYIVYGGEKQLEVLLKVREAIKVKYIIMNSLQSGEWEGTLYEKLLRVSLVLEQDIGEVDKMNKMGINTSFIVHEAFLNKNERKDNPRPSDALAYDTDYDIFHDPSIKYNRLSNELNYSVNQLITYYTHSKWYISWKSNDWVNINRAIACGCKVVSCLESEEMMTLYKPYVLFQEDFEPEPEWSWKFLKGDTEQPDFKSFQDTITTFSLNKYLPLLKELYGEKKEKSIDKPIGETEGSGTDDYSEQTKKTLEQGSQIRCEV